MGATLQLVSEEIAIAIVEKDEDTRSAMKSLLSRQPGFTIVADAADVLAVNASAADPDIILLDYRLRDASDWVNTPGLAEAARSARVIATGVPVGHSHLVDLIRVGVAGFVVKDALFAELVSTIRAVASGRQKLPTRLVATLVRNLARTGAAAALRARRETRR